MLHDEIASFDKLRIRKIGKGHLPEATKNTTSS
jgi:hypothetical protein